MAKLKHIKTSSGFECDVDTGAVGNDMELLDAVVDLENGNPLAISVIIGKVLDKDTKKRLYDHVRDKNGRVPIDVLDKEITEIMTSGEENDPVKK